MFPLFSQLQPSPSTHRFRPPPSPIAFVSLSQRTHLIVAYTLTALARLSSSQCSSHSYFNSAKRAEANPFTRQTAQIDVTNSQAVTRSNPHSRNYSYDYFHVKISLKLLVKPLLHSVFSLIT